MKAFVCIWLVFWITCTSHRSGFAQTPAAQSKYLFEHFDTDDGLPSNFTNSVVQDSLGFIWFLHDNGLSRYDGYQFKIYLRDSTDHLRLSSNTREGMLVLDNSGNVCVTSQQSREADNQFTITKYDRSLDSFHQFFPEVKRAFIACTTFDKKSALIYMGSLQRGLFEYDPHTDKTQHFINDSARSKTAWRNTVFAIHDQDTALLLATGDGLWKFNKTTKRFSRPPCSPQDAKILYNSGIVFLHKDTRSDHLWLVMVGEQHHLIKVDKNLSIVHHETHPPLDGEVMTVDKEGAIWFTTNAHGLYRYHPDERVLSQIENNAEEKYSLQSNFLRGITIDRDQNIWVTTADRGVSKLKKQDLVFYNFSIDGEVTGRVTHRVNNLDYLFLSRSATSGYSDNQILFMPVARKHLSVATFRQIPIIERANGVPNPSQALSTRANNLCMGLTTLWIGSWHEGITGLPLNPESGMVESGPVKRLEPDPDNPNNTVSGWSTTGLWEDGAGNLWVGTRGSGLNKVDPKIPYGEEGSVTHYRYSPDDSASISNDMVWWSFYPKDEKSFWVVTASGIDLFSEGVFKSFLKRKNAMTLQKDSKGTLLIGTTTGLITSVDPFDSLRKVRAVPLDEFGVTDLSEDDLGRLWIINHQGLVCYDPKNNNSIVFSKSDDIAYSNDWIDRTSEGLLITSDAHGFSVFDPLDFHPETTVPKVLLISLLIKNKTAAIGNAPQSDDFKIKSNINVLDQLILDHKSNHFSLEFSAMEFISPEKNRYRYKLEGYDDDWIETDAESRTATYTNLDAGDYIFKVKASNHHGIWSDEETTLAVVILPPPWKTWWAYALYAILLLALISYWRNYEMKRVRLKQRAAYLTALDHAKTRFFSNISHEFRTPVTLILGPIKELEAELHREDHKNLVSIMRRNAQRLLRLINQLLDLSKLDAGKMHLRLSRVEMVAFLREIAAAYESLARQNGIHFLCHSEVTELVLYVDKEKVEKIIHNLLSNAFKFTSHGKVIMTLRLPKQQVAEITVQDTGSGIPSDQLDKVFDRFYQVNSSPGREYEGSGIGMALAKELVQLHHGVISVQSIVGKGTIFRVTIPEIRKDTTSQLTIDAMDEASADVRTEVDLETHADKIEPNNVQQPAQKNSYPMILVVEDNRDMRTYICRSLMSRFRVIEAPNGKEGILKAQEIIPDLIISDIMMPEMDGYKLCELIKTNELTSHIPVILLTAKADRESKLAGLKTGADDYLTKPFDADELKLIIKNRIEERRKMKERFSREVTLEPRQIAITSMDEKFLTKVLDIIELHMDEETFSIVQLSQEVGYSHIHFYRKIKALSGQSPNQFLRTIRLKRAAELLRKKSDNIAQIAYRVGFGSESYFIKCFREQFGITPRRFMEENQRARA